MANDETQPATSASAPHPPGVWRFGVAVVDEREATLAVAGSAVALDRSSYDVLLCLLRHAGEVMGKEELLEAGWPGRVVSENSLAKAISRLRVALGPDGSSLKVVHGYGYRLTAGVRFEAVPLAGVHAHPAEADRLHPGDPLPHRAGWRLGQRLGEGSGGIIHLAEGPAGDVRAVKLAIGEAGLRSLKREVALERYMAASAADVPGLARLLGWNLSHPPFFLEMPYYAGGNLREWVDARGGLRGLDLALRLAMCASLCDTLAALHAIGIVHKDLKPENLYPVAAGPAGEGWGLVLSDLGAGQAALTPRLAELDMGLSIIDQVHGITSGQAGNLLYMAPEVIAGEVPTQRSDVFALGVLLYQLVVGDLRRSLAPGWELDVEEPLLREDIAAAAAADPHRRLLDPAELASRLRRLDARRDARAEAQRLEETARRHAGELALLKRRRRRWIAGSAVLAVVLGLSLWQQQATLRERRIAEEATAQARAQATKTAAVVEFLTEGILRQADPYEEARRPVSLRQAVDRAARDIDARFAGSPEIAAAIHGALAAAYEGMNDFAKAVTHFDKQVRGLRAARPRDRPAVAKAQAALCTALHWNGEPVKAEAACKLARADFLAAGLEPDRAEVFLALGDSRRDAHRDALARLAPRMDRIRRSGDQDLLGFALWFQGAAQLRVGEVRGAERTLAELVAVRQRESPGGSMSLAWALADHGKLLLYAGRRREGERELLRAQSMFERIAGADNPQSRAPAIHLAADAHARGRPDRARALARPHYEFLLRESGWQLWTIHAALTTMVSEARVGNSGEARRMMAEFSAMADEGLDDNFPYLREPHWTHFLETHLELGEPDRAQSYLRRLEGLARSPHASVLLAPQLDCYRGAIFIARGEEPRGGELLASCRRRLATLVPPDSSLLGLPQRLSANARHAMQSMAQRTRR